LLLSVAYLFCAQELPSYKRKEILLNVAEKLKQREEELANIITVEVGKPIRDSRAEVGRAVDTFTVSGSFLGRNCIFTSTSGTKWKASPLYSGRGRSPSWRVQQV
jgi:acyl-CoA reductase-like NAD-dependent aldehyde dehydrogenase